MSRRALVAVLAFSLAAASCSNGSDPDAAATIAPIDDRTPLAVVNGASIPIIDVTALHDDFAALDSGEIAGSVLLLVLRELFYGQAGAQFSLAPGEADIAAAVGARVVRFGTRERADTVLASRNETPARMELEAELDAVRDAVARHLVISEAEGFDIDLAFKNYLLTGSTVCVRHIQVLTQEGYDLVARRIAAGEDFGVVALENSLDPLVDREDGGAGAGGDLGCRSPESTPFPEAAIDAVVGEVTGPVFSSVGTHLIQVYEREAPELADVREAVLEVGVATQGVDLFNAWAVDVLRQADVTIDDAFGAWGVPPGTNGIPTVIPPGG